MMGLMITWDDPQSEDTARRKAAVCNGGRESYPENGHAGTLISDLYLQLCLIKQIVVHPPQQYTVINQTNAPFFGASQFPEELESKIHLNCSFTRDTIPTLTYCDKFDVTRPLFLELH